ncbi:MAG: hypothetical protein V8R02_09115 [Clostridium sp.]
MKKSCSNCQFNFYGICASHISLLGYGSSIIDFDVIRNDCDGWEISIETFIELELLKNKNVH